MALTKTGARIEKAVPVVLVADIARTMRCYIERLGFSARAVPASPPHSFCIMTRDDVTIFLQQLDGYAKADRYDEREGGVWDVYLQTNDVHAVFQALSGSPDVLVLEKPRHQEYGQTELVIRDPNGYVLVFAEAD